MSPEYLYNKKPLDSNPEVASEIISPGLILIIKYGLKGKFSIILFWDAISYYFGTFSLYLQFCVVASFYYKLRM